MRSEMAVGLAAAAIADQHEPARSAHDVAARTMEARAEALAVMRRLEEHGWTCVRARYLEDVERERRELLEELAEVTRQRDRLLDERVEAVVAGGGEVPWPLDRPGGHLATEPASAAKPPPDTPAPGGPARTPALPTNSLEVRRRRRRGRDRWSWDRSRRG